jgi:hypothetical protein
MELLHTWLKFTSRVLWKQAPFDPGAGHCLAVSFFCLVSSRSVPLCKGQRGGYEDLWRWTRSRIVWKLKCLVFLREPRSIRGQVMAVFRTSFLSHIFRTYELEYSVHPDVTDMTTCSAGGVHALYGGQDAGKLLRKPSIRGGSLLRILPCIPAVFVGPYTGEREGYKDP